MKAQNCRSSQELGLALYTLSESCIFRSANETEKAIVHLLQQVSSWRQFYRVLERMHPTAQVVPAVDSINRTRQSHRILLDSCMIFDLRHGQTIVGGLSFIPA
ncbi:MAG: hypothetical protein NTV76_17085 [Pseudomonas sp.]|nr:hypothetical protein [Pseudomonas sp.]